MGYVTTTGILLYWKADQPYYTHIENHACFDEYISCLSSEENHTPGYLQLQWNTEIFLCHQYI